MPSHTPAFEFLAAPLHETIRMPRLITKAAPRLESGLVEWTRTTLICAGLIGGLFIMLPLLPDLDSRGAHSAVQSVMEIAPASAAAEAAVTHAGAQPRERRT